jgi:hypothetical protein
MTWTAIVPIDALFHPTDFFEVESIVVDQCRVDQESRETVTVILLHEARSLNKTLFLLIYASAYASIISRFQSDFWGI